MSCFCKQEEVRDEERRHKERSDGIDQQLRREKMEFVSTHRLLLLGAAESGKSTVVKQMKILHWDGFSTKEKMQNVHIIRSNVREVIQTVIAQMDKLNPPVALEDPQNELRLSFIKNFIVPLPEYETNFSTEFYQHAEALWNDEGVQKVYRRSNEYHLLDCASYFMETTKLREVASQDYIPSNNDILRARKLTEGIYETRFTIEKINFHIFDVGGQRGERRKWIQCFTDITAIIYVVATSGYNMVLREDNKTNRLKESLNLYEEIWNNRWLRNVSVILFLNKMDVLKEKIGKKIHLDNFYPDFLTYLPPSDEVREKSETNELFRARFFIRDLFLLISNQNPGNYCHFCYPHFTTAIDTENIRRVFESCRDIIQRLHLFRYQLL